MEFLAVPGMLHLRWYYSGAAASAYLGSLSEAARHRQLLHTFVDCGFIACLSLLLMRLTHTRWVLLYTLADLIETAGLGLVLLGVAPQLVSVLGVATALKWIFAVFFLLLAGWCYFRRGSGDSH